MAKKTRRSPAASGSSFLSNAITPILISSLGLLVAFALIWWQVIRQPQDEQLALKQARLLDTYVSLFNGRIDELQGIVNAYAKAPHVAAALTALDDQQRISVASDLVAQHPFIVRVDLIEKDRAEVDLNAQVPVSFAALDLIRRAETREFVGPEVSLNQRNLIYAAQPITPDGIVIGVLLVVFDTNYFLSPLNYFAADMGNVEVRQQIQGSPSTVVMQWGSGANLMVPTNKALKAKHWTLAVAGSRSALAGNDNAMALLAPFAVALVLVLGGILLGYSMLARKLKADADTLSDFTSRLLRGRSGNPGNYQLSPLREVAHYLTTLSSGGSTAAGNNRGARASADDEDSDDLLKGIESATANVKERDKVTTKQAMAKSAAEADDFLDVSSDDNFGIEVSEQTGPLDMGLDLDPGIFRAYDIRGITTSNLTEDVVYWIGRAFAAEASAQNQLRVAVGWDGRHSSVPLQLSLTRGLTEGGVDVITIGQVPTPMLYFATYALDTGTGIMITGSHNPPEYNGLKMMIGGVTLAEERIQQLYHRISENNLTEGQGDIDEVDLDDNYIDRILEDIAVAQPLKVVVDCGNGVAGKIAPRLMRELGCEVIELYCEVDGDFPNHHPDPAEPKNLEDLITVVKAESADLGLAFDGDGDRVGVVTNSGEIIWPDKLLMLFAQDIVSRNPGADIIYDVKCSRHLNNIISELGGRPIMWKTGHSHIKAKIKETGALLGGEFSGHICFAERWYGFDDALYSAARLLEILGSESRTVDEVFAQFPITFTTPEIKITTTETEKFRIMERLAAEADFGDGTLTTIDGLRVDFADAWGLIRPSNTSPVLSLRFEADGPAALDRIQDEFQAQLNKVDPKLRFRP